MAPTQPGLVLRRNPQAGTRRLDVLRWGLVPHWSRGASGGARLMDARAETLAEKPSFRQRRCLVPIILSPKDWAAWLDETPVSEAALAALLRPAPDESLWGASRKMMRSF